MQKKKLSDSYYLFFIVSICISWWLVILGVSISTTSYDGTPSVKFDFPVMKKKLFEQLEKAKDSASNVLDQSQYGLSPLIVVHEEYLLVANLNQFEEGIESVATKISSEQSQGRNLTKFYSALNVNLSQINLSQKMVVILPTSKTSMRRVVQVSSLIKKKYPETNLVFSTEVL